MCGGEDGEVGARVDCRDGVSPKLIKDLCQKLVALFTRANLNLTL